MPLHAEQMTIGTAIRSLRHSAGLSQRSLAEQAAISTSYLSLIESGHREASISLLRTLANALGTPATILFAAALGADLVRHGRHREAEVIRKLIDAERLNLLQERLPLDVDPEP